MPNTEHLLERRSHMLAAKLVARREVLMNAVTPEGARPPFSEQLTKAQALRFWQKHRYDDIGQRILSGMKPEAVMELDQALSGANERAMSGGTVGDGT